MVVFTRPIRVVDLGIIANTVSHGCISFKLIRATAIYNLQDFNT